jgi:hypothetical protein
LISSGQLKDALAAYGNPRMKISRLLAAGELTALRRGLYLRDRSVDPHSLSPAIYGPSYVSFASALAWHGLIPERVEEVVCATLRRPARFETPVGRYRYRHVPARVFAIGIERVEDPSLPWLLASPTKALCDAIALEASVRWPSAWRLRISPRPQKQHGRTPRGLMPTPPIRPCCRPLDFWPGRGTNLCPSGATGSAFSMSGLRRRAGRRSRGGCWPAGFMTMCW